MRDWLKMLLVFGLTLLPLACAEEQSVAVDPEAELAADNPFLEPGIPGKGDTQYVNPDGVEVEVDLEADLQGGDTWNQASAPAKLGQFALTYLRKRGEFYLESLAEDSSSRTRVEWLIDGTWRTAAEVSGMSPAPKLDHFRIRGVNAVLLHSAARGLTEGKVFKAKVPLNLSAPPSEACTDPDDHMGFSSSIYWYIWNPDHADCKAEVQEMTVTVSKLMPKSQVVYPEYDQLLLDKKVTAVVLFGMIGEGDVETDTGMRGFKQMARWLTDAKFTEVTPAPVGRRFSKQISDYVFEIDLYSPKDFSGLSDYAHLANFERAIGEHEIVVYDGHSMLGASDFWSRKYPEYYQIFLYGGCLGYEYYIAPILKNKQGGWGKLDIMSSVVEVTAGANEFAGPVLAKLAYTLDHGLSVSWVDMLKAVRSKVGDSTFGLSGVRDNCYSPTGSLCGGIEEPTGQTKRYESKVAAPIPDDDQNGVEQTIEVPDDLIAVSVIVEVDVTHTYSRDLRITLEHDGVTGVVWDHSTAESSGFSHSITLSEFAGKSIAGKWRLKIVDDAAYDDGTLDRWTLVAITR